MLELLEQIRPERHRRDVAGLRAANQPLHAAAIERSAADYAAAAARLRELGPA